MNQQRFDTVTRFLGTSAQRRGLLGALGTALLAAMANPHSALACKKVGKKCDKNKDCCDGARCEGDTKDKKGKCRCKGGFKKCGNDCVNLDTNEDHCGGCDNACAPDAVCDDGACVCGRTDNAFACGTDGGECGPPCADNEACVEGTCVSCAEACPGENCSTCIRLADGATLCALTSTANCPEPCTSSDDCEGATFNLCAVSRIVKSNRSVSLIGENCLPPTDTGLCTSVRSCSSP